MVDEFDKFFADTKMEVREIFEDLGQRARDLNIAEGDYNNITYNLRRSNYYNYYSSKRWGEAASYDLCLNRSKLGFDGTVEAIVEYIKIRKAQQKKLEEQK